MIDHTLGVVLAGGRSRRMGVDKASIVFDGATLLERAVGTLSEVFAEVVVAGGTDAPPGTALLPDTIPGAGPLAGLDAAYAVSDGRAVFLMAVDMPFVDVDTVVAIVEPVVGPMAARVPVSGERRQPLCAVYGAGLGPAVKQCLGEDDRSMTALLSIADVVDSVDVDERAMTNVNTADDLAAALREPGPPRSTR